MINLSGNLTERNTINDDFTINNISFDRKLNEKEKTSSHKFKVINDLYFRRVLKGTIIKRIISLAF